MSFIFSKIRTKEEKNWPCFREPFTSNLCLFFFFFLLPLSAVLSTSACLFLHFVLPCLHFSPARRLSGCLFFSSLLTLTTSLLFLSAAAAFLFICQAPGQATHTHVHHSSCISRSLCDPSLRVHTDSPLRCSQILAVALASHRAPGRAAQRKHTRAPAHASARAHTHKDEHGHAQLRRSTLGGHKYRAVHMHTLEQGGVGE